MATDDLPDSTTPADGAATQNPAPAPGGLWKAGIAAAVVAAAALVFVSGCGKRDMRSSRSSDSDSSSERDRRKESGSSNKQDRRKEGGSHSKVQLWEGGPYWAETNIDAENPEDYGYYFWWGDTVGYKREGEAWIASDGSSRNFEFDAGNAPTCGKSIDALKSEGWITKDGVLAPEHDAARVHWGGDWRMPTRQELEDLLEKCNWIWTTKNGVKGYVVRGRDKYASASIFLPCAGYGYGTSLYNAGSGGYYWSSVPRSDGIGDSAWGLYFNSGGHDTNYGYYSRDTGQSVRPVQGFIK